MGHRQKHLQQQRQKTTSRQIQRSYGQQKPRQPHQHNARFLLSQQPTAIIKITPEQTGKDKK